MGTHSGATFQCEQLLNLKEPSKIAADDTFIFFFAFIL